MNKYFKNLSKIEFVVTDACTGRCKHCSEGDHRSTGIVIDPKIAADAVRAIAGEYEIKTVLAFGGEPLLYTDAVYAIIGAAREMNIPKRQIITNGYFTRNTEAMRRVAKGLYECGVNDLLLSVDAFHQETIPLSAVREFAKEARGCGIPIRLQPAWLTSPEAENPYNEKTWELIESLSDLGISANDGNIIFPEGNAAIYLSEYFGDSVPSNPYIEDPCDLRCVSFAPNGDVLDGNVYGRDIMEIINSYSPREGI